MHHALKFQPAPQTSADWGRIKTSLNQQISD
jgi:hypothetical protein